MMKARLPVPLQFTPVVVLSLAAAMNAHAQYNYAPISVPGAHYTVPLGIDGNNIIGQYANGTGDHQFLYNGTSFTTLNMPSSFQVAGISGNKIVGSYFDGNNEHGFFYNGGSYITLDVPGANTWATGISGNNIVGYYDNGSGHQGFLYNGSTFTTLNVPGSFQTTLRGISGNNIVGYYSGNQGFLYDGNSFTTLSIQDVDVIPTGISGNNIVGYYNDGIVHGFMYDGNSYTTFDAPGADDTFTSGISGDTIVGFYNDSHGQFGFVATPVPEPLVLPFLAIGAVTWLTRRGLLRGQAPLLTQVV